MRAPPGLETARLVLRPPARGDAEAIFTRYAGDAEVTRWLGWARHRDAADSAAFTAWSDLQWMVHGLGPYLAFDRDGLLVGGTGLTREGAGRVSTGYVLARDAWGRGYATEALLASVEAARAAGVRRLEAGVHVDHHVSCRVLEKAGFVREGVRPGRFPNLPPETTRDAAFYSLAL